ncbi:MAG: hypothetical protein A2144_11260 [Chloroflexi bacterium RBG_16_50_9]|nr:MAG: hypothetical protein A2144_11260 [Chloroflexi bacterium RBG_16_50_9]
MKDPTRRLIEDQDRRLMTDQDRRLVVLLRLTTDAIVKVRRKELRRKYGVSIEEWGALSIIRRIGDKATPAEIARWMFREHHSVVALLNRMEKKGLVKKTRDLDRKNMMRVRLTEKGEQVYITSAKASAHRGVVSDLSKDERRQLIQYLTILRDRALEKLGIDYKPDFP